MKTTLLKGLTPEQETELKSDFVAATFLRQRLQAIMLSKIEGKRAATRSDEAYGKAAWPYLQADALGYEKALFEVISLLES